MKDILVSIERLWRTWFVYPLFRLILNNQRVALPIDLSHINSLLVLRYDKIGDMIVTLPIFRILKARNPNLHIGVLASESNVEIVRGERSMDDVFILYRNPIKLFFQLTRIRKRRYQIVLNFIFNRMTSGAVIANFFCRDAVSIGQGQEKYAFYFNALIALPRGTDHMVEMLANYVEQVFGLIIGDEERVMHIPLASDDSDVVNRFLGQRQLRRRTERSENHSNYVVFNVSARQGNNRISERQALSILSFLGNQNVKTVVVSAPEDKAMGGYIVANAENANCFYYRDDGIADLGEIAWLIEGATGVITPDTAIIHIASAVSTPVLGIFTPIQVNQEWLPYKVKYQLIKASEGQPVETISEEALISGVKKFLELIPIIASTKETA